MMIIRIMLIIIRRRRRKPQRPESRPTGELAGAPRGLCALRAPRVVLLAEAELVRNLPGRWPTRLAPLAPWAPWAPWAPLAPWLHDCVAAWQPGCLAALPGLAA